MFNVVNLEINHRQEGCKTYADLLNRMRTSNHTEDDIKALQKRVFRKRHPIYKKVGTYVVCTKMAAMEINDKFLAKQEGEEIMVKAIHSQANRESYKPVINKVGQVGNTGFMDELRLKVGSKVMLIHNLDVEDCLTNGQMGTLAGVVKAANGGIKMLVVNFNNKHAGKMWREKHPGVVAKFPGGTGIEKMNWSYSLKKNSQDNLHVVQHPIVLADAVTAHKMQVFRSEIIGNLKACHLEI